LKDETMKSKEIESYRQDLRNILNKENDSQRHQELVQLAKKVGAGYVHSKIAAMVRTDTGTTYCSDPISESELVLNINNALQTETMINTLKIATWSWRVALIAVVISIIALIFA
jgi:hypothetical protein